MQCTQSDETLRSEIEREINVTLSTVPGCQACILEEVIVPECESKRNRTKRREVVQAIEVLFSLLVKASPLGDNIEEKSEAVLFQMQYTVATGQFMISLHGMNSTADRSSLKHLFSNVVCSAGFLKSKSGKRCGRDQ